MQLSWRAREMLCGGKLEADKEGKWEVTWRESGR